MTLYNVRQEVVELVEAESPEAAIRELRRRLLLVGFEPFIDVGTSDAFESEPL